MTRLTDVEIISHLEKLSGWSTEDSQKKVVKEFTFKDFAEAMQFANQIANIAEAEEHHPYLLVSWGKVRVELSTHDVGGLSEKDFTVAGKIDALT